MSFEHGRLGLYCRTNQIKDIGISGEISISLHVKEAILQSQK